MGRKSKLKKLKSQKYILCEGKSEEKYFSMLKRKYRRNLIKIKCVDCGNKKILTEAAKLKKTHLNGEIYVAFDADEMSKVDIEWCKQYAQRNNLHLIFSNVCFEVWILLHYEYFISNLSKQVLFHKIADKMEISNYEKFKGERYDRWLYDRVNVAASNADKLRDNNPELYQNPYTDLGRKKLMTLFDTEKL
ncbi:hypothetical protein A3O17_04865 [Ligilactobacillus aviarius]|uniref:RloB family protein n=1 Tax=Ligilactobacillus aviarius TaxID=1606 RepID=UPI0007D9821E|nr:RloB family protein [Ligilactobacillus aviarius]OAQ08831.1 hypothetical protein A3O15_03875 [Ligilactobacillus aviarius]OAS76308.1 hypothetical protein A3O17_04865 [Ligilactobacillus aviarius]